MMRGLKVCHETNAAETKAMFGAVHHTEWDLDSYHSYNPSCIVRSNAQNIRDGELLIYIDAADNDFFCLYDGAEFLHKTLWQYRIHHEYHLYNKADHIGPSLLYRGKDMFDWLCRNMKAVLEPSDHTLTPGQELFLKTMNEQGEKFNPAELPERAEPVTMLDQQF